MTLDTVGPVNHHAKDDVGFPTSIDLNPTARCNLRCTFCWGPDHALEDGLSTGEWMELLASFRTRGTQSVVFTGGEPLLRQDIGALLRESFQLGYRVTLSTNTLLLARRIDEVRPWIHEIGLPLDGSSPTANSFMRRGRAAAGERAFATVLSGMSLIRTLDRPIEITVRTVVSRQNYADLSGIGKMLTSVPALWDRWKLYQFVSAGLGESHSSEHELPDGDFEAMSLRLSSEMRGFRVHFQSASARVGRYLFIGPRGDVFATPQEVGYRRIGDWKSFLVDPSAFTRFLDHEKNMRHARPSG